MSHVCNFPDNLHPNIQANAWDEEFFNMDGQAYIQIHEDGGRRFDFGAV
ncbi:MAG: hypothetical protein HOE30_26275 [Deltaproteobacteria bacterium]|mgnify:CR=1 FL=1|nr:hypothetical protein [Deltaproteobacteria bacterium]MBT4641578.1 hypothetical protein [Deltaproteobacteria bacterium]